jgi:hypothetical protein
MRNFHPSLPKTGEIQFQLSLLNLTSLGEAKQAKELEKLLVEQETKKKR